MKKFFALIFLIAILICGCQSEDKQIKSIDDLKHARIGTWPGSAYELKAQEILPDAQIFNFYTLGDMIYNLQEHKIEAFIIGKVYVENFPHEGFKGKYLPQSLGNVALSYIFSKNERGKKLCAQMNEFLAKVEVSGELDALKNKWLFGDESGRNFTKTPSSGENGKLKIVTETNSMPFVYVINQEIVGYEVELIDKFCAAYGYTYEIEIKDFLTMLADVATDKADIGMNALEILPEREKNVLFANPHYIEQAVAVVYVESLDDGNFFAKLISRIKNTLINDGRWKMILEGTGRTLAITFASIIFGTLLGFAVYMIYREGNRLAKKIIDGIYRTLQGVPILVLLLFFYYVIFGSVEIPASFIAVVVFSIVLSISVFVMLKSGAESISRGQTEAALSLGFSERRAFLKFILPQVIRNNFKQYQLALNVTLLQTAIVGYISVQDLTKMADLIRARTYDAFLPIIATAIIYLLLSKLLMFATDRLASRINPKNRSREKILEGVKL